MITHKEFFVTETDTHSLRETWYRYPLLDKKLPVLTTREKHGTGIHNLIKSYRYSLRERKTWYRYPLLDKKLPVLTTREKHGTGTHYLIKKLTVLATREKMVPVLIT